MLMKGCNVKKGDVSKVQEVQVSDGLRELSYWESQGSVREAWVWGKEIEKRRKDLGSLPMRSVSYTDPLGQT